MTELRRRMSFAVILVIAGMAGCASKPAASRSTTRPGGQWVDSVVALCYPPTGWIREPLKSSSRHQHQIWVSPRGGTAYGVIHFSLPFPLTDDLVLWGFMNEMKRSEGSAELLSRQPALDLSGIRFVARGGLYTVRVNLTADGWEGWAVYAGTKNERQIDATELIEAQIARDQTVTGRSAAR
ncbi:hypothetical protein BH10PLA1_BH10PLA1_08290 [soil metagenome]